uniref:Metallothionein n=1 Tax=Amphimedon queenslandica TaxID=400682 RepID=A0A1X7V2N9_AMPQE
MAATHCCQCNGKSGFCHCCACVNKGLPCSYCLLGEEDNNACCNHGGASSNRASNPRYHSWPSSTLSGAALSRILVLILAFLIPHHPCCLFQKPFLALRSRYCTILLRVPATAGL